MDGDQTGKYSRILPHLSLYAHSLDTILIPVDSIWGVVDIVPETDFPDLRNWAIIQSNHGTLMNIPREGDMVRFYIQLPDDTDLVNRETGRVDMAKANAERIIESAAKIMAPFSLSVVDKAEWWTVYISASRCYSTVSFGRTELTVALLCALP